MSIASRTRVADCSAEWFALGRRETAVSNWPFLMAQQRDRAPIITALRGETRSIENAMRPSKDGGLPQTGGFYAWWVRPGSLADIPTTRHPSEPDRDLLYVGIGPASTKSSTTLRSRVIGNHLRGNIGSSTFRLSLAALLLDYLGLRPTRARTKVLLSKQDNARLTNWQRDNLRLTWCEWPQPWKCEPVVIETMNPPLNLAGNSSHAFYATLKGARARLRAGVS